MSTHIVGTQKAEVDPMSWRAKTTREDEEESTKREKERKSRALGARFQAVVAI